MTKQQIARAFEIVVDVRRVLARAHPGRAVIFNAPIWQVARALTHKQAR